jgi:hypothetical protein
MRRAGGGVCLLEGAAGTGETCKVAPACQGSQTLKILRIKLIPRARYGLRKALLHKALRGVRVGETTKLMCVKPRVNPQARRV